MEPNPARCLILACGNTLREDDGIGPFLCAWAEQCFETDHRIRCISRMQWTPELAEDVAFSETVLFLDCALDIPAGKIALTSVCADAIVQPSGSHHFDAGQLLNLGRTLYDRQPREALLLKVGASSTQLREGFSSEVEAAIPEAKRTLEDAVARLLAF